MVRELLQYSLFKRLLAHIFFGSQYDNVQILFEVDSKFEEHFFNEDNLNKLSSLLNGCLSVKVFDDKKLNTIQRLMNFYLDKHSSENNQITQLCTQIIKQTNNQKGKSNKQFYKEQYEIRTGKKCLFVTEEIKNKIDNCLYDDIIILNQLMDIRNGKEIDLDLNNEDVIGSIVLFMYECPDLFYIEPIHDYLTIKVDAMDENINDNINVLNDFLAKNLAYIGMYMNKIDAIAYYQTIFSQIYRKNLLDVINSCTNEELDLMINEDLLEVLEMLITKNEELCMFESNDLNNIRELVLMLRERKIIDNEELNKLKVRLNVLFDNDYEAKNRTYYEGLYGLYMNSQLNLNNTDKQNTIRIKSGLDNLMVETGKILNEIIDFDIPESIVIRNSDLLFHINYIINKYPILLENEIYADRIKAIVCEYYNNVDETKYVITENQKTIYAKVKKKIEKTLR